MTKSSGLEPKNETPITKMGNVLLRFSLKYMPDASIFAVALTFIAFGLGIALTDQGPMQMVQNWYKGFWELLGFSMQMALIVITGSSQCAFGQRLDQPYCIDSEKCEVGCVYGDIGQCFGFFCALGLIPYCRGHLSEGNSEESAR